MDGNSAEAYNPDADLGDDEQENEIELAERFVIDDPSRQQEDFMFEGALNGDGSITEYTAAEAGKNFRDSSLRFPEPAEEAGMHIDDTNTGSAEQ
ncbi:hypothetical protein [Haloglycomyces albus]|uniref:hypothetical protein n=1 Tax=Haloglycomyces albus TaxID=526067 RepID=UPI00046CB8CA|nr:hypothetical protein [Haloglycomyces albus]